MHRTLFGRVVWNDKGEKARLEACRELWQWMQANLDLRKAGDAYFEPDFTFDIQKLRADVTLAFRYVGNRFSEPTPITVAEVETKIREWFDDQFRDRHPGTKLQIGGQDLGGRTERVAEITDFPFEYHIAIAFALKSDGPEVPLDRSPGPYYLAKTWRFQLTGERMPGIEEYFGDIVIDPLELSDLGYEKTEAAS